MSGKESFPDFSWMNRGSDKSPGSPNEPAAPSPNAGQEPDPVDKDALSSPAAENLPVEDNPSQSTPDPVDKNQISDLPATDDVAASEEIPGEVASESADSIEAPGNPETLDSVDQPAESSESDSSESPENALLPDDTSPNKDEVSEENFIESNTFVISKLIPETPTDDSSDNESSGSADQPEVVDAVPSFENSLGSINQSDDDSVQVEHLERETEHSGTEITRAIAPIESGLSDLAFGTNAGALIGAAAGAATSKPASPSMFGSSSTESGSQRPSSKPSKTNPQREESAPKTSKLLIILASYASAITIGFLLLLVRDLTLTFRPHQLESLPDIPAEKAENLTYVPTDMKLPQGHTLSFGVERRFGNILVEPIKITHEPATFVHYSGDAKKTRDATAPIWKLWLKLTNVSTDQTIAPLDRRLVLRWVPKARQSWDFTNQYITNVGAKSKSAPGMQLYYLPAGSDWDMKDQFLGKELGPGESYVTYLASSDEGFDNLGENLLWRVQIRKGYSPKGHGVTTVFEVPFRKDDVEESQS
ncbi:hypothetical protein [Planctomicrobium sp. SH527]|uniref:hypothetical protein n=1 Tax=Planctomicrobium sp. SH527 TaxID=3448123 RepID=UPI003F5C3034